MKTGLSQLLKIMLQNFYGVMEKVIKKCMVNDFVSQVDNNLVLMGKWKIG